MKTGLSRVAYAVYQYIQETEEKYLIRAFANEDDANNLAESLAVRNNATFIVVQKSLQDMWCDLLEEFGINPTEIFGELL